MEIIEHNEDKFVSINVFDIDLTKMTKVHKVSEVVAAPVFRGVVKIITKHKDVIETINYAKEGDYIVYEVGVSNSKNIIDALLECDKKIITKVNFHYLYQPTEEDIRLSAQDILSLTQELVLDNNDNKDFTDTSFLNNLKRYKYIGKSVYAASVPFNFVIKAPWGHDQFIKRGGLIIYDTNIKSTEPEIYGIEGAHDRVAGEFEKTFTIVGSAGVKQNKVIADTFKIALKADRSPISGIQFNNIDLAKAYDRAGKKLPHFLKKFLPH